MGFRKIDNDPLFSSIAPYYISQILYMQKKYDEVIEFAPPLMDSMFPKGVWVKCQDHRGILFYDGTATRRPYLTWKPTSQYTAHIRSMTATSWPLPTTRTRSTRMPGNFLNRSATEILKLPRVHIITLPIATSSLGIKTKPVSHFHRRPK